MTASLKIGADSDRFPLIPKYAPVEEIADMASHGVEYLSALSQFFSGKITMMRAMDRVGLSGVSMLYNLCSVEGIRNVSTVLLSRIPIVGSVLGNLFGGIVSATVGKKFHEKLQSTVKKLRILYAQQ